MKERDRVILLKDKRTICYQMFKGAEGFIHEISDDSTIFWVKFLGQRRLIPCYPDEIRLKEEE